MRVFPITFRQNAVKRVGVLCFLERPSCFEFQSHHKLFRLVSFMLWASYTQGWTYLWAY